MNPVTTKKRTTRELNATGTRTTWSGSTLLQTVNYAFQFDSYEQCRTQGNPWPPVHNQTGFFVDFGNGEFLSQKATVYPGLSYVNVQSGGGTYRYKGPISADGQTVTMTASHLLAPFTANQMAVWGTEAINRTYPTQALADLGQFLAELRQFPKLFGESAIMAVRMKDKLKFFKSLGSDYLNYEFGWRPFLKTLVDTFHVMGGLDERLEQYVRDSGKLIRRKCVVHKDNRTTQEAPVTPFYGYPALPTTIYSSPGKFQRIWTIRERVWFSGAYSYYLPKFQIGKPADFAFREALFSKAYGLRLTPSLLYELAPWSWFADWIVNAGNVLENAAAFAHDKLVLRYGYLMAEQIRHEICRATNISFDIGGSANPEMVRECITRQRIKAKPYGFGTVGDNPTPRQQAILAALATQLLK